jgi:hypothetical protein
VDESAVLEVEVAVEVEEDEVDVDELVEVVVVLAPKDANPAVAWVSELSVMLRGLVV